MLVSVTGSLDALQRLGPYLVFDLKIRYSFDRGNTKKESQVLNDCIQPKETP